jgi:hypothetical protein
MSIIRGRASGVDKLIKKGFEKIFHWINEISHIMLHENITKTQKTGINEDKIETIIKGNSNNDDRPNPYFSNNFVVLDEKDISILNSINQLSESTSKTRLKRSLKENQQKNPEITLINIIENPFLLEDQNKQKELANALTKIKHLIDNEDCTKTVFKMNKDETKAIRDYFHNEAQQFINTYYHDDNINSLNKNANCTIIYKQNNNTLDNRIDNKTCIASGTFALCGLSGGMIAIFTIIAVAILILAIFGIGFCINKYNGYKKVPSNNITQSHTTIETHKTQGGTQNP